MPPGSPFRGPGGPPLCFALEQAIDEAAIRLQTDPIDAAPALGRRIRTGSGSTPGRKALDVWRDARRSRPRDGPLSSRRRRCGRQLVVFRKPNTRSRGGGAERPLVRRLGGAGYGPGRTLGAGRDRCDGVRRAAATSSVDIGRSDLPPGPMAAGSRSTASLVPAAIGCRREAQGTAARRGARQGRRQRAVVRDHRHCAGYGASRPAGRRTARRSTRR